MKLTLIRHGLTEGNIRRLYYGAMDLPLLPEGIEALHALRDGGGYPEAEQYFTSGMTRTEQTFAILFGERPHEIVRDLREIDFGHFEMRNYEELKDDPEFGRWLADSHHQKPPEGESGEEFLIRIQAAVAAMIDYMAQNEIFEAAVVTHGGVIATLMSTLGLPRQPLQFWKTSGGRGFTCFVHPQIWQNDHLMEVAGILPHGAATACDNGTKKKG